MADTIMRSSTADPRLGDAYSVGFGANYKIGDVTPRADSCRPWATPDFLN